MIAHDFKLTAAQDAANELLGGQAQHIMLFGGSRSGKTFLQVRAIVVRALAASKSRHAILRFTFASVKNAVIFDTFPKVMELCFPSMPYSLSKQDWFAEFPNGSQIWFGGLDDKERTEKILGQEFATIMLNECSQIPKSSRDIAVTRLAQKIYIDNTQILLRLKMYYDENPPTKGHWTYKLFIQKRDPETKGYLQDANNYASMQINPESNIANLPPGYIDTLKGLSQRLQRRFLRGEFADDNPDALFREELIDRWRVIDGTLLPDMQRIVIAVDPSGASGAELETNDSIGIVVAGLGTDGNGYVLEDLTCKVAPALWGKIVVNAYTRYDADMVVGEANFGGAMVHHVVQSAAKELERGTIPYKSVTASRGKVVRAEPISSLYEFGKVRHVGVFNDLEDELCGFSTKGYMGEGSPNRADADVWAISELFPGIATPRKAVSQPERLRSMLEQPHGWSA